VLAWPGTMPLDAALGKDYSTVRRCTVMSTSRRARPEGMRQVSRALGGFEQVVLLAMLRLGDETHGVVIRREIEDRTRQEVSTGALYTTLERLEKRGLVTCRFGDGAPERGGRRRKLYRLAPVGLDALRESYETFASMVRGVETHLRPADDTGGGSA